MNAYRFVAASIDFTHALLMLGWGLGLPLLVWHRFPRLSRAYMWFALGFVGISVLSHELLDECVLTTLARWFWRAGGGYRDGLPFMAQLANFVAGVRPSRREVVLVWEAAVVVTSVGSLWCWRGTVPGRYSSQSWRRVAKLPVRLPLPRAPGRDVRS